MSYNGFFTIGTAFVKIQYLDELFHPATARLLTHAAWVFCELAFGSMEVYVK